MFPGTNGLEVNLEVNCFAFIVKAKQFTSKFALIFCVCLNEHSPGTWN